MTSMDHTEGSNKRFTGNDREAMAHAVQLYRKPNGDYNRSDIRDFAGSMGISERTVRRIIAENNIPAPTLHPLHKYYSQIGDLPQYRNNPEQMFLQTLAHCMGIATNAHALAQQHCGYPKGYRSFLREMDTINPALVAAASNGRKAAIYSSLYLVNVPLHRNETWHIDSTMADVRLVETRGLQLFRPHLTVVTDAATGMIMSILAARQAPNTSSTALAITMAAATEEIVGTDQFVGGLPTKLVFDNGSENINHAVTEGCMRLGIQAAPTNPRSPWQNGQVERAHRTIRDSFLSQLSGSMSGGVNHANRTRFAPESSEQISREDGLFDGIRLLKLEAFICQLEDFRRHYNSNIDSSGTSPLHRWLMDPTQIRRMEQKQIIANMSKRDRLHKVSHVGINFQNKKYQSPELGDYIGKKVSIRYLPNISDWIEVFDDDKHIGRAYDATNMPEEERSQIINNRDKTSLVSKIVDKQVRQRRNHMAALMNEQQLDESQVEFTGLVSRYSQEELQPVTPQFQTRKRTKKKMDPTYATNLVNELQMGSIQEESA